MHCYTEEASKYPLVCVAMPAYNASNTISSAIKSILQQTYSNWHLFVIDDGSSDETINIVKKFGDPRIQAISDGKRLGLAARLNQAIDRCEGEYFARLDADDVAYPERLEKQVNYLLGNANLDLLGTGAIIFDNTGKALGHYPLRVTHKEICKTPWSGFYIAHPTWMGKINWFRKYKYRIDMPKAQDQDLLLRSYTESQFAVLPEILNGYRHENYSFRKMLTSRFYLSKALIRVAWDKSRYTDMIKAPVIQVAKAIIDVASISTGFTSIMTKRRALPVDQRVVGDWDLLWSRLSSK